MIPATDRPDLTWKIENIRPAHGAPGNPCAECTVRCGRRVHCNQLRSGYTVERARRIIAEWAEANAGKAPPGREKPQPGSGRPW